MASITAAVVLGGVGLASSAIGASAAGSAADTQASAANTATAATQAQYAQTRADLMPWQAAGNNALQALMGSGGLSSTQFAPGSSSLLSAPNMANFQSSPGYNYQMQQMMNAVQNSASAQGSAIGGNTLQALQTNAQGLASQDYWNWYNAQTGLQNRGLNYLQALSGGGQNAAAQTGAFGSQAAGNIANTITQAGNANAAGTIGVANSVAGGLNGVGSNYLLYSMMNGGGGGAGTWAGETVG